MSGKKLLILGGTRISLQILEAARQLGLTVYVADYNEDSPCKQYADKSFLISATDVDGILDIIRQERIDGVLMGYADVLMDSYREICEESGLPCYLNKKAVEVTTDKKKFKEYCKRFNIPTVEEYSVDNVKDGTAAFPLIVKPVDNSGARGIFICNNSEEFESNHKESLSYSKAGNVLIEKMMTGKEATIFYYLHDGGIYLLGIGDRWMYQQKGNCLKLPIGYTFPSEHLNEFKENQDADIRRMFSSLDMKEGMVFIQCFVEDSKYVVYEMGYRLTGSLEHHIMDRQYGFNHLKSIVNFAVGNKVDDSGVKALRPEKCCMANVTLLLKEGEIGEIKGIEELSKDEHIAACIPSYISGESITEKIKGTLAQVGMRVLLTAGSNDELLTLMDKVKDNLHIVDKNGDEMIIKDYSYKSICRCK